MATSFTIKRYPEECEETYGASKLFGGMACPEGFFDTLPLEEGDYFVGQISCAEVPGDSLFPKTGYFYFFLNIDSQEGKVFYADMKDEDTAELVSDINEAFDVESCGDPAPLKMEFCSEGENENIVFGNPSSDIGLEGYTELENKLVLLQIDGLSLPEGDQRPLKFISELNIGYLVFLVEKECLERMDFSEVETIAIGD